MGKFRAPVSLVCSALTLLLCPARAAAGDGAPPVRPPALFVENAGQCADAVRFQARCAGLVASVLDDGLLLDLDGADLRLSFRGACAAEVVGLEPSRARAHFLAAPGAGGTAHDAATFARVRLAELYPGVDLEVYTRDGLLEYDLVLAPGAEAASVALAVDGADALLLDGTGALCATAGGQSFQQRAPIAWQTLADGQRRALACAWEPRTDGTFGFALAGAEPGAAVVIDPVLEYEGFVGGSNADEARAVCVDAQGCAYVTGWARSADFPGTLPPPAARARECVVFKLAPGGQELLYATYLGGRGDDVGTAIRVNDAGEAFVAGTTQSTDFPTTDNAYDRKSGGGTDAFLVGLSADGAALAFATLLGGAGDDSVAALELAPGGEPTLAGTTRSRDFPVSSGSYSTEPRGGRDAFVARLDPRGERLVFSTRLGGSEDDEARGLTLDEQGCAYLTGCTSSSDFPTTLGALDREHCGLDAFVAKLSAGGRTLLFSTFLGGTGQDSGTAIDVDAGGRAVVVGWTQSLDFPFDARRTPAGRKDGFAVRLSNTGNALSFATPVGGGSADEALGVCLDPVGAAWVVGTTRSNDFPFSEDARGTHLAGAADAFLVGLSAEEGRIVHATYLGGEGEEELCGVHLDAAGTALVVCGFATDIPVERRGPLTGKRRGPADAFVLRFDPRGALPVASAGGLRAGLGF